MLPLDRRDPTVAASPSHGLITLIQQARKAQLAVDADRTSPIGEIAARFHRQAGVFARLLRLNYLAPDIVAAILDGQQPPGLTRRQLLYANLPTEWSQQRALLGFAGRAEIQLNDERYH